MKSNEEKVLIPTQIEILYNIKTIGFSNSNTYFLTNNGFIYFRGGITKNKIQMKPILIESDIKFNDFYSKEETCIAINDNSNEIFELKYNCINKLQYNNIFEFYSKNNKITYKTIKSKEYLILKWIQNKEIELNSQKVIENNMNLEEINNKIQKQNLFHSELQIKPKELIELEENINQFMDNLEIKAFFENSISLYNKLIKISEQREQKLREIENILEFKEINYEKYKIEFISEYKIGSGAFGDVYKVKDISNNNLYAVKIISGILNILS